MRVVHPCVGGQPRIPARGGGIGPGGRPAFSSAALTPSLGQSPAASQRFRVYPAPPAGQPQNTAQYVSEEQQGRRGGLMGARTQGGRALALLDT